jgi:hypothetical protein
VRYKPFAFVHAQLHTARTRTSEPPKPAAGMKLEESGNTQKEGSVHGAHFMLVLANIITPILLLYPAFGWRWYGASDDAAKKARRRVAEEERDKIKTKSSLFIKIS